MTEIITRFAPSPTGFLHIGGARTALFNWLYARHHGGRFRLRIEDTDRERSTTEAIGAILDGLAWLGLDWDGEVVYQSTRATHHAEAAQSLLARDKAYRCYCTPEELAEMRERRMAEGLKTRYDRRWRDRDPSEAPPGVRPVIRFKAPLEGETIINDLVQGEVRVDNSEFDDIVLLRSDGTPTYTLAVVVDDHEMGVTTVIRGVDHLTNAFQHTFIFEALGWNVPAFAHVPLIHGPDGARLSKRHGALGVGAYREQGYLPEAMRNYLLRLGWSHGDDEIISTEQALEWFGIDAVGRSPARFDFDKLDSLNGHYLRQADDQRLAGLVAERYAAAHGQQPDECALARLVNGMQGLKQRAKTISELAENAYFYLDERPLALAPEAAKLVAGEGAARLARLAPAVAAVESWDEETLERAARAFAAHEGVKLGDVAQPLRAALTGSRTSPGIFEVMVVLGRAETLARIGDVKR
ncbi:MAG: glutamate--tRNA ligase [Proteobacteria bacterium]|nr:glutamate--tRNA ligase [Pseudomonadota bacterium]